MEEIINEKEVDFFLSHASEDKSIVEKVYTSLSDEYNCWFDKAEIFPGDNFIDKIFNEGLSQSKYVIFFLSKYFLNKEWPKQELKNAIARQINKKDQRLIPYLIDISYDEVTKAFPFFETIYCGQLDLNNIENTVKQIKSLVERDNFVGKKQLQKKTLDKFDESDSFSFEKIINRPVIQEVIRIKERFHVYYFRAPDDLYIEIHQNNDYSYYGFSNYSFWGPDQAIPYRSMHQKATVQEALNDALEGLEAFDSSDYPSELVFFVSDNDVIYDGTGELITMKEAQRRRSENKRQYKYKPWTYTTINGGPWWLISKNFDNKEFSVIGPIDDDSDYDKRCSNIRQKNIDFRIETVPVSKMSKEQLIEFFQNNYGLKLVDNDLLYSIEK